MPDEESCRSHALFTHGKLLPRCESKVYFNHLKRIEAARRLYNMLIYRIRQRERNNKNYEIYTRSFKNYYKSAFNVDEWPPVPYGTRVGYWLRKHMVDCKNLVLVENVLEQDGILVEVDGS
jgi:hypothetical protein